MPTSLPLSNVLTTQSNPNSGAAKVPAASSVKPRAPSEVSSGNGSAPNKTKFENSDDIRKPTSNDVNERASEGGDTSGAEAVSFKRTMQAAGKEIKPKSEIKAVPSSPINDAIVTEPPLDIAVLPSFVQFQGQWSAPVLANNSPSKHWSLLSQLSGVELESLEPDSSGNIILPAPSLLEAELPLSTEMVEGNSLFFSLAGAQSPLINATSLEFAPVIEGEKNVFPLKGLDATNSNGHETQADPALVAILIDDSASIAVASSAVTLSNAGISSGNGQDTLDFMGGRTMAKPIISSVESPSINPAIASATESSVTSLGKTNMVFDGGEPSLKALDPSVKVDVLTTQALPLTEQTVSPTAKQPSAFQQALASTGGLSGNALELSFETKNTVPLNVAFGQTSWSNSLAERTAWMVGKSIQTAEIQLDPPELGSLHIKIHMHQDQASVNFVSANPHVRDAVEQSIGRLRELLQDHGLELVDSGVADQRSGKRQDPNAAGEDVVTGGASESLEPARELDLHTIVVAMPWSVDYYA